MKQFLQSNSNLNIFPLANRRASGIAFPPSFRHCPNCLRMQYLQIMTGVFSSCVSSYGSGVSIKTGSCACLSNG